MLDFSVRKILTIPNFISASRIIIVPFIGWLLFIDSVSARLIAGFLLFLAILSDFLDGWLARLLDQVSDLGKIIDPLADKLFVILLAVELIMLRDFPLWLALLIIIKDALIIGAGVLVVGKKRVVMQSNIIGKYAFGFQAGLVVCYFLDFPFGEWLFTIGSVALIAASLISYGKALLFVLRSREEEVIVPPSPEIVPAWARRVIVLLLLILVLTHFYFWVQENTKIDLTPTDYPTVARERAVALAARFSPVFIFAVGDSTRPVSVEYYLGGAELRRGDRFLFTLFDHRVKPAPLIPSDLAASKAADAYLTTAEKGYPEQTAIPSKPQVYVSAVKVPEGGEEWTVIQYWLLLAGEDQSLFRRGNWRVAVVVLDPTENPRYLALSQNYYGSARQWSELELEDGHPMVYIASGSRSLYFSTGEKTTYLDEERLIPFGSERVRAGERLAAPGGYGLKLIGTEDEEWLKWPGRWSGPLPGGDRGPRYWNPKKPELAPWSHPLHFTRVYLEDVN